MNTLQKSNNRDTSTFPFYNTNGRCGYAPEIVIHNPAGASLPTIKSGLIQFPSGISNVKNRGINYDGASKDRTGVSIPFAQILPGGSGVQVRCCVPSVGKVLRAKCCDPGNCSGGTQNLALSVQQIETCKAPLQDASHLPFEVKHECLCSETCCQKLNQLVDQINKVKDKYYSPVSATLINQGGEYFIQLTASNPNADFRVVSSEGLGEWVEVVPFYEQNFNGANVNAWHEANILASASEDECFKTVELFWMEKVAYRDAEGVMTSNPNVDNTLYKEIQRHAVITFQEDNPGSPGVSAAYNKLLEILQGGSTANEYISKVGNTNCPDNHIIGYCIKREDAGDATALTAARAAYSGWSTFDRFSHDGTYSYYTAVYLNPSATPTAAGTDTVTAGPCSTQNQKCTTAGTCPDPESSCCGCKPTAVCSKVGISNIIATASGATYKATEPINLSAELTGDAPIVYAWSVEDGAQAAVTVDNNSSAVATFTPAAAGEFTITLTATNCQNNLGDHLGTSTQTITVTVAA